MRHSRSSFSLRSLGSLTLLVVVSAGALWQPAALSAPGCARDIGDGGWDAWDAPVTPRTFAVLESGRVLAADDRTLFESDGLGCPWREIWRVPNAPTPEFPYANERITRLAASDGVVLMALSGPHVLASSDGGRTWIAGDDGLMPGGVPSELVVSAADERVAYLGVDTLVSDEPLNNGITPVSRGVTAQATLLYRSTDGGLQWELVARPYSVHGPRGSGIVAGSAPGTMWDVKVDPLDANAVWAATTDGLFASNDGGKTWAAAVNDGPGAGPDVRAVDVMHRVGSAATITAVAPGTGTVYRSTGGARGPWSRAIFDGLKSVYAHQATDPMIWLEHAGGDGPVIASGPKGVFLDAGSWTDVSALGLGSGYAGTVADLIADPSSGTTFWGRARNGSTIYRYSIPPPRPQAERSGNAQTGADPLGELSAAVTEVGALAPPRPARLSPARATVRLRPGESTVRTFHLDLPPRPTPLDVYFLLDSTDSTANVIRALARGVGAIATRLRARGIDVWVGVGEFRTYPQPREEEFAGEAYNFAYRQDLDLAPPGKTLLRTLMKIEGAGASGANLTALYQAVTGQGQEAEPPVAPGADIPEGMNATFRPGAVPVIVHVADEWFATPERGDPGSRYPAGTWPGPTFEQAIDALTAGGIHHVGAALGRSTEDHTEPGARNVLADLRRVSLETSTVAPAGGIDCDGDGRVDLDAGQPLVCGLPYENAAADLLPAITGLLDGVRDLGAARLVETSGAPVVAAITPSVVTDIDLKEPHRFAFGVTFECPRAGGAEAADARLAALLGDEEVATAHARVICRAPAGPVPVNVTNEARPVAPVVPVVPPPPPPPVVNPGPAPVNAPAPAAEPAPAPAQAPAGQPQTVAVQQRQLQPQVALVHAVQQTREQLAMEHAMVGMDGARPDPLENMKYGLATATLSLLLVWGMGLSVARAGARRATVPFDRRRY